MSTEQGPANDQPNSANDTNSEEQSESQKSEEFVNFERGLKHILALSKEQVERLKKRSEENPNGAGDS